MLAAVRLAPLAGITTTHLMIPRLIGVSVGLGRLGYINEVSEVWLEKLSRRVYG